MKMKLTNKGNSLCQLTSDIYWLLYHYNHIFHWAGFHTALLYKYTRNSGRFMPFFLAPAVGFWILLGFCRRRNSNTDNFIIFFIQEAAL